jgi:hypothetical protein
MRRVAIALLISIWAAPATVGVSGTWTGKISDAQCGPSHKNGPPTGGQRLNDAECADLCFEMGAKYVFVTDSGVYSIANQNFKGLRANIGDAVQLEGDLSGTTITVSKISKVEKKKRGSGAS